MRGLALVVLAAPPVTFLLGLVSIASPAVLERPSPSNVLCAGLASLTRRFDRGLPPVLLFGLLWLVLAVDIATGGHLPINTIFGYSPIVAGRFAGFGNQAFSMIALSSLLLAAVVVERRTIYEPRPWERRPRSGSSPGSSSRSFSTATPRWGPTWAGLAFVPAATVSLLMFRGTKVRVRLMALIAGGTVAILAAFAALDLNRPSADRTHLGRFVAKLFDGDAGEIIERKIAANLRVLTSVWAWVIPSRWCTSCT